MKTILRVAKTELRTLFYSPIAWFILIVLLVQCGLVYVPFLERNTKTQELGGLNLKFMSNLTSRFFLSPIGIFQALIENLYLYLPLLTMGLISRETNSGTIKLLYSSPIKVREIVFGKFLAMMIFNLLLIAMVSIFVVSGLFHIRFPETAMLMTGLLGFYLLLTAYSAIGLFMSSLTTYQMVAAVSTFVMIGALTYIGTLWQDIPFIRSLTYFLSISGRAETMLEGLLTTKDVIYFIIIIYMFLGLTVYKLKAGRESKPVMVKTFRYVGIIASALLIGYISAIPSFIGYYDATSNKEKTITPNTQKIIADLGDAPLEITAYNNLLGRFWYLGDAGSYNMNHRLWEPYIRFKHNIELKTVSYYDDPLDDQQMRKGFPGKTVKEIAEQFSKTNDIDLTGIKTPQEIRKIIDLRPELNRYVMQLKYKGRTTFLRVFDDQKTWPDEAEVSAALKRLLQAKLPKVAFLTGNLERSIDKLGDRDYEMLANLKTFRNSLMNQGFDIDTVSLETQDIPKDISTLVVADPKFALSPKTLFKIKQYINSGGNILITGEPNKQAVLNPLLKELGVQLTDGIIVQQSQDFSPDLITADITPFSSRLYKPLAKEIEDSLKISMPGATGLLYNTTGPFTIRPLLMSDKRLTWLRKKKLDMEMTTSANAANGQVNESVVERSGMNVNGPEKKSSLSGIVTFSNADGDIRGPIATALSLTRKINGKEQRIVVTGDADFMSNSELLRGNIETANFVFNTALFSWLSYGQFPIDTARPDQKDNRLNVSKKDAAFLRIVYLWVLPGLLLAFGAVLLIRRQRK